MRAVHTGTHSGLVTRPSRPGLGRRLWYVVSGRLAWRYREWVLYDLTTWSWPLRRLARLLVPLIPVAGALWADLPGPLALRVAAVVFGSPVGLGYTFVVLEDSTDRRAVEFGYPTGTPGQLRRQRAHRRTADSSPGRGRQRLRMSERAVG